MESETVSSERPLWLNEMFSRMDRMDCKIDKIQESLDSKITGVHEKFSALRDQVISQDQLNEAKFSKSQIDHGFSLSENAAEISTQEQPIFEVEFLEENWIKLSKQRMRSRLEWIPFVFAVLRSTQWFVFPRSQAKLSPVEHFCNLGSLDLLSQCANPLRDSTMTLEATLASLRQGTFNRRNRLGS